MTHVYRLIVGYPAGSREGGWQPPGWEPSRYEPGEGSVPFGWPLERQYLSRSGALQRKALLESWGAVVTVEKSDPVTWPGAERVAPENRGGES